MPNVGKIVGAILIILFVALSFPVIIEATNQDNLVRQVELGEGDSETIEEAIRLTVDAKESDSVNLTVTGIESGDVREIQLNESENGTVQIGGETVTIGAIDIAQGSSGTALLEVDFPKDLAWSGEARRFSRNLPIAITGLGVAIVGAIIVMVIKP